MSMHTKEGSPSMPTATTRRNGTTATGFIPNYPGNPTPPTPAESASADTTPETPAGVIRWEDPYGSEPAFAQSLRDNPCRYAVVYEGTGLGWIQSRENQWLLDSPDAAGFQVLWVPRDSAGEPLPSNYVHPPIEAQSKGTAHVRYGVL